MLNYSGQFQGHPYYFSFDGISYFARFWRFFPVLIQKKQGCPQRSHLVCYSLTNQLDLKLLENLKFRANSFSADFKSPLFIIIARCLIMLLVSFIIWVRWQSSFLNPQFWAEDGQIFFVDSKTMGIHAFLQPFAGYLHLVPRTTAFLSSYAPSRYAPALYIASATFFALWTALTISLTETPLALLYAATFMLVPHTGEVFATVTNAQWIMACAIPLIAVTKSPKSTLSRYNQITFMIFSSLSGPFIIWAAPLFLIRLLRDRSRHTVLISMIVAIAACVQIYYIINNYVAFQGAREPFHLAFALLDRWFGSLANGWRSETSEAIIRTSFFAISVAASIVPFRFRKINLGFAYFAGAVVISTWLKFMPSLSEHFDWPSIDDRYLFIPKVMAVWMLIGGISSFKWPVMATSILALALIPFTYNTHDHDFWRKPALKEFPWTAGAQQIDSHKPADIPINPEPYRVKLP